MQITIFDVPIEDYRPVGPVQRSEECLCGGWIRVENRYDESEVTAAVRLHNGTERHLVWRAVRER